MKNRKVRVKESEFREVFGDFSQKSEGRWEHKNDLPDETRSECFVKKNGREIWLGKG